MRANQKHFQAGKRLPTVMQEEFLVMKALYMAERKPGWMASMAHTYNKVDIYPLAVCEFNGVFLSCPRRKEKVLVDAYGKKFYFRSRLDINSMETYVGCNLSSELDLLL